MWPFSNKEKEFFDSLNIPEDFNHNCDLKFCKKIQDLVKEFEKEVEKNILLTTSLKSRESPYDFNHEEEKELINIIHNMTTVMTLNKMLEKINPFAKSLCNDFLKFLYANQQLNK